MLKKEITYENFDGETVKETVYFHISKTDLFELEIEHNDGLDKWLKHIAETNDRKAMYNQFKELMLLAYGQRSEDGKRFIKSKELSEEFLQTGAFEAVFLEILQDENAAIEFIAGCLPKELSEAALKSLNTEDTPDVAAFEETVVPEKLQDETVEP